MDVILTFLDYTLLSQTAAESLLPFAAEHDIGVINGSPIAMGLLSGVEPDVTARPPEGERAHKLWQWAMENNQNLLNLAIQFCLRQPLIHMSLTGSKDAAEVEQNFAAATTPVPEEIWEQLAAVM